MSACTEVRKWITEKVRQPIEQFFSQAEEKCTEARRWVEREVRTPIERRRTRTERKCKRRKCKWWCLCCNKWFCWLETIIERIIEWIVEVIGEWLVETVCKIIVKVIKIIVEVVITVVRLVVVGLTCLFTNPRGALDALIVFWYDLTDIVSDVGDLVGDVLGAVSNLLDFTREFILDLGDLLGPLGRFFLGIVAGILDIGRRIVDGIRRIVEGIFEIVTGILHLDFCTALEGLTNGVGFGLGQAIFGATGVLSLAANGPRDAFSRSSLREWLQGQLEERFHNDRLEQLEELFQMDSSSFGVQWPVYPRRCSISSRSKTLNLRELHRSGVVDLYEVAGYAPFGCDKAPVTRSVYELVYKDTEYRVSLGDLRAFLSDGPSAAPEFVLVAGDKRVFKDVLEVARRKLRQLSIFLDIKSLDTFEIQNSNRDEFIIGGVSDIGDRLTNTLGLSDFCDLLAVVVFGYDPTHFGLATLTSVRIPGEPAPPRVNTIATIRTSFMAHLFGTVLAHEMGHCFSLRHEGHDGMENIMFTLEESADLENVTPGTVVEYILLGGEPYFTLQDGKDAWNWILTEAIQCF
jgi:hypothetical protein